MRQLLRNREARIFLLGWTTSVFGDWAMFFVLAIWAKDLTHSNSAAGLVFFALALPSLTSPLAGVVVDRLSRRKVMIWTYSAEAVGLLSLLFVRGPGDVWIIYAVTFFYGFAGNFAAAARNAFVPLIVPRELLGEANGIFQTTREGLRLIAPLTGALIYAAVGGHAVAVLDSVSFLGVVVALLMLRVPEPKFEREEEHFLAETAAGARHILATPVLRTMVLTCTVAFLTVGFSESTAFAALQYGLHRPASFFGVLGSAQGAGAIAGGLLAGGLLRRFGDLNLVALGMISFALGDATFVSSSLVLIVFGIALAGAGVAWFIVGLITSMQLRTPSRLQGRVSSAVDVATNTPQTISIAVGAGLIALIDYRLVVIAESVVLLICGLYLASRRGLSSPAASAELPSQPLPSALPALDPPVIGTTAERAPGRAESGPT